MSESAQISSTYYNTNGINTWNMKIDIPNNTIETEKEVILPFNDEIIQRQNNQIKTIWIYEHISKTQEQIFNKITDCGSLMSIFEKQFNIRNNDYQISYELFFNSFFSIIYDKETLKKYDEYRENKIEDYKFKISTIISQDEYIDGEISQAEQFMKEKSESSEINYLMEALMQIYYENISDTHILEGILMMISSVPYDFVAPKGQIMALGLLSSKELILRDRAIECYERWNSKKGLSVLKNLNCSPKWLQKYVNNVIADIEKDGSD